MKKNIFVISTIFLGIVVVALLFTIATLQSENSDLRNVVRNQANQISEADRYYNNVVARGMLILCIKHWIEVIQKSK